MSRRDVDVVLEQFAAVNGREFERAMELYDDDVELVVPPGASLEAGTFKGKEEVGRWFGDWFHHFEPGYHFDIEEARDLGDAVLIVASHGGRGRSSGAEVEGRTAYRYAVRGGKVARVEFGVDRDQVLEAAGVRE